MTKCGGVFWEQPYQCVAGSSGWSLLETTLESMATDRRTQEHEAAVSLARRFIETVADVWKRSQPKLNTVGTEEGASESCAVERRRGCCLGGYGMPGTRRTTHDARQSLGHDSPCFADPDVVLLFGCAPPG